MSDAESFFSSADTRDSYIKNAVPAYAPVVDWALSSISQFKPKEIIDIGCGLAHSTQLLQQRFGKSKIVGLDVCPYAIAERVIEKSDSINFNVGTVDSLLDERKLKAESFDLAFTSFFSSEFDGDEEYEYFEPLVANLLSVIRPRGRGLFVHNGPDCEDFLIGLGYDTESTDTNVLRPVRAEWKLFDCIEYGFVEFHVVPNNFDT